MNKTSLLFALVALALAACGSGSSSDGIEARVDAVAQRHDAAPSAKHGTSNYKTFRREDGMRIDLQRGQLSLVPVALEPCGPSLAGFGRVLLDALLPAAQAHGGGSGEAGGVIDAIEPDLSVFALGALPAEPGDYCGLVVELLPAVLDAEHDSQAKSDGPPAALAVSPCYYPNTVGVPELPAQRDDSNAALFEHRCIDARYAGPALRTTLAFEQSVRLDGSRRTLHIVVGTSYDRWLENVAMDRLADDAEEQARLMQQVLQTLHVHAAH